MRRTLVAALVAGAALSAAPVTAAHACDPNYDPQCQTPCTTFNRYWFQVQRILSDPPPKPVC
jgi:hypothetical protein